MILGLSSSKFVTGNSEHRPRWPQQPNLIQHRTIWEIPIKSPDTTLEEAMQRPFHQSLVAIGQVVSEKKIFKISFINVDNF
jgi:hypothetical protein